MPPANFSLDFNFICIRYSAVAPCCSRGPQLARSPWPSGWAPSAPWRPGRPAAAPAPGRGGAGRRTRPTAPLHVTRDRTTPRPRGTWVRVQVVEEGRGVAGELGGVAAPRVRVLVVRQPAATCPHVCLVLPTPGQSCKLRFPKITRRFHNHGEGPYKDLLLVKIAY